mmetsp:Transcript_13122/g.40619  ORF Transcript_13122/g.40619 Transcript_13122/m.40619 type:complete len:218 (+) Transcript_13122:659-1312(+)
MGEQRRLLAGCRLRAGTPSGRPPTGATCGSWSTASTPTTHPEASSSATAIRGSWSAMRQSASTLPPTSCASQRPTEEDGLTSSGRWSLAGWSIPEVTSACGSTHPSNATTNSSEGACCVDWAVAMSPAAASPLIGRGAVDPTAGSSEVHGWCTCSANKGTSTGSGGPSSSNADCNNSCVSLWPRETLPEPVQSTQPAAEMLGTSMVVPWSISSTVTL